jgi:hypothetical protein
MADVKSRPRAKREEVRAAAATIGLEHQVADGKATVYGYR